MIDDIFVYEESLGLAEEIINNLDDESLKELYSGSEADIERMIEVIHAEASSVLFQDIPDKLNPETFDYLDHLSSSVEESLRKSNLNYFISSVMPSFKMNWHHVEWCEFASLYKKLCLIAARDHGKSFFTCSVFPIWKMYKYQNDPSLPNFETELKYCAKGVIMTNEQSLAEEHIEILKDIVESNDVLSDRLMPDSTNDWGVKKIKTKNGARLQAKSYRSKFRGRHPGYMVVDDFLDESCLYSKDQRDKFINYFHSVIMNALLKKGQIIVSGTPFHDQDLYEDLKKKPGWGVFTYPSVYPDGSVLWEGRYNLPELLEKRDDQGPLIFSREHLCTPIVSDSSIFPRSLIESSIIGMEKMILVDSVEAFPVKCEFVVTSCDFAMSSSVGADYSVFLTAGVDSKGKIWLMHYFREKGKSFREQINVLKSIHRRFRPDLMLLENNQFQQIFVEEADKEGMPVQAHTTGAKNKNDLKGGVPGLSIQFSRHNIKFPYGNEYSINFAEMAMTELGAIAFTDKGLQGVGEHDDIVMSLWLLDRAAKAVTKGFLAMM